MKIILSGGGTGGHIYPALAIAGEIRQRVPSADILYVGSREGMENHIVPLEGLNYKSVDISGIDRSSMLKASKSLVKFPRSFFQAWDIIKEFKPDVVVGTGGYVSFPVVLAATFFACKTVIHEQNAVMGLANRKLARRADYTLLTFEEAGAQLDAKRTVLTGLPVRKEILEVNPEQARRNLGIREDCFTLVAFGGSRGARSINRAVLEFLTLARKEDMQLIWITGNLDYNDINKEVQELDLSGWETGLQITPFMYNIEEALAIADLAVCRAGASTLSELADLGLPAILIPYPYAAENHQEKNARALLEKNAVDMVIDEFLDGDTLYKKIQKLRGDESRLSDMSRNIKKEARPNALNDIVDIILE
jgi:UDP-N-acetylglucosamine--N-acetylmuramyl-(pentapeptide) pyrophosphoryl-undecaprenol N-acetylglucosamine transferase